MTNIYKNLFRGFSLIVMLVSLIPMNQPVQAQTTLPPVDMFQLPWELGKAWVALDGFDDGSDRLPGSPHNFHTGGAVDFAPRAVMFRGEDTSNFWVTAAAAGTIAEISKCHMKIDHGNGWVTEYQHLANIQVHLGDTVARNQRLAIIANASSRQPVCAGSEPPDIPHLHFTLRPNMVGATFAGWQFKYNAFFNSTTFAKDGKIVTLFKPLLNELSQPAPTPTATSQASATPTLAGTSTPGTPQATNTPDQSATATSTSQATNTPDQSATPTGQATNTPDQTATATPTPASQSTSTPTPTPAGQSTSTPTPTPAGSFVTTRVDPTSLAIGETALTTVSLDNVPPEGYTSTEFTCTFNPALVDTSNITVTELFGTDAVAAINMPQDGTFIIAIAGTQGKKATTSGAAFTFDATALQAGQTTIDCQARVSKGDNILTPLPSSAAVLTILEFTPTPTFTPAYTPTSPTATPGGPTSTPTAPTPTSVVNDWLTFTNVTYGFQFKYPPQGQIVSGGTDTFTRINLPFTPGTNLSEKYLEVAVAQNANPCRSPVAASSIVESSETVTINGITFLKEIGGDAAAGNLYQFVAYSTQKDNVCVSLSFVLHSLNPGNFATPPPVFDYAAESAVFEQIVGTYMWLSQSPTATPTIGSTPVESPTPESTSTPVASPTSVPSSTPTMTPTASPTGMISGQVISSKPATISVYDVNNVLIASVPVSLDGRSFAVTLSGGTYTVIARASGFLSAQGSFTVISNMNLTLPTITLLAGDIDNNEAIDQFDALTIGMSYNGSTPAAADLNSDGIINVLDLELLAQNYRDIGPTVWQ